MADIEVRAFPPKAAVDFDLKVKVKETERSRKA